MTSDRSSPVVNTDIAIVGTGSLGRSIAEALASTASALRVLVVGRDLAHAREVATIARACAAAAARPEPCRFSAAAGDIGGVCLEVILGNARPRVVVTCASPHSPWESGQRPSHWTELIAEWGTALTVPLQAQVAANVARCVRDASPSTLHVNACLPDLVNAILHALGLPVLCGVGNVQTLAAALQATLDARAERETGRLRLLAHHLHLREPDRALEARAWRGTEALDDVGARLVAHRACGRRALNAVTGQVAAGTLAALATGAGLETHLPGPHGLPGGYPAIVEDRDVRLDLPAGVTLDDALDDQRRWAAADRIGSVEAGVVDLHAGAQGAPCCVPEELLRFEARDLDTVAGAVTALRDRLRQGGASAAHGARGREVAA